MAVIRFAGFAGENRAVEPKLLAESVCTVSRNQKPGRGDLRPWKTPSVVATVPAGRTTIYRMGRDVQSDSQYWMSWNTVVNAIRGFSSDDTTEQTFYTGDGAPKFTNNVIGLSSAPYPTTSRPMGIPAPLTAPTINNVDTPPADAGKHELYVSESEIAGLKAGDVFQITVGTATGQQITLVNGAGNVVTSTSLAAQIDALTGVSATVVSETVQTPAGVRILSDVKDTSFKVEKKTGTTTSYDQTLVTYSNYLSGTASASVAATAMVAGRHYKILTVGSTAFTSYGATDNNVGTSFTATGPGTGTGTVTEGASVTVTSALIGSMAVDTHFQVTVNGSQPVSITVPAGTGTFPSAVTADTVFYAFGTVSGVVATVGFNADGVTRKVVLETEQLSSSATLVVKTINPATVTDWITVGNSSYIAANSNTTASRYYVYTYVNDLGWESAASPTSSVNERYVESTATITGFATPPAGNYGITTIRIYKTQTGSDTTNFFFLREIPLATTSTTDDNRDLGELLPTTTWLPAPGVPTGGSLNTTEPTLTGLTAMWNGMMAGISGNGVRVCEAYVPYAWPKVYEVIPPDSKPVALGVFGQNMLVLTTGRPLMVNGSGPDGLDQQKIEMPQACVAVRSVVSMGAGVAWASEDGLCWYGTSGPRILTAGLMLREDWQKLVPSSIIGCMYEGLYFGSYDDGTGRKGFFIDPANPNGIYFMDTGYSAMYFDELRDHLYVLDGTSIKKWDEGSSFFTYLARSKVFKQPFPTNYGAAEVVATSYPVTFRLYADGLLKHTETVAGRSPFRLPGGFRAFDFQIEMEGTGAVQGVAIATAMQELSDV